MSLDRGPAWRTVVCVASGPSLTPEQCAIVAAARRQDRCRVIVINTTWERLPEADVLYGCDVKWWGHYEVATRAFAGERWTQVHKGHKTWTPESVTALGLRYVNLIPNKSGIPPDAMTIFGGGNSGFQALSLAYLFAYLTSGKRIILVGFDMQRAGGKPEGRAHWHADHPAPLAQGQNFNGWIKSFNTAAPLFKEAGVEIINCTRETALTCFPRADLATTLDAAPMNLIPGLTSIIIPTYNDGAVLADAIASALAQTVPVEVIVVDDGSDHSPQLPVRWIREARGDTRGRWVSIPHAGPAAARNAGIEAARGEFVMFLDADDVIAPDKVERQLAEMEANLACGWVLSDVDIVETSGKRELASKRYRYAEKHLDGWIAQLLAVGNFIPIMAPLIRRSALGDLRFPDCELEDWHFWYALASAARVRYLPAVLSTYRKRSGSRNTVKPHPSNRPGVVEPLRLNLGCGTPGTRSWHPIPGMVNLDRSLGWRFEDGLRNFGDGSVAGITVSHALMYVAESEWPRVFGEFARVLAPGGVLRVTEDDTANPESVTYPKGWTGSEPAVTRTDPAMARRYMEAAGFTVHDMAMEASHFDDLSLCQAQHGKPPNVFFIEGVRECAVLFEPHADDCALFASFLTIRHKPRVVTCFPSSGDYGDTDVRAAETREAVAILGGGPCEQWNGSGIEAKMYELDHRLRPTIVFAPSLETSHADHTEVAGAATRVFGGRLREYHTYRTDGKVRGEPVPFESGWCDIKRRALACYRTQIAHPRARQFFEYDLAEYTER